MIKLTDIEQMQQAYMQCALWSTTDYDPEGNGDCLDAWANIDNISDELQTVMKQDCQDFYNDNGPMLEASSPDYSHHGHDFWLTRNHHGAGFWDRGYTHGDELTAACEPYGSHDIYGDYSMGTVK
jgi:hypothetical protein